MLNNGIKNGSRKAMAEVVSGKEVAQSATRAREKAG
jgi:hypothetical protein